MSEKENIINEIIKSLEKGKKLNNHDVIKFANSVYDDMNYVIISAKEEEVLPKLITDSVKLARVTKGKLEKFRDKVSECHTQCLAHENLYPIFDERVTPDVELETVLQYLDKYISNAKSVKLRPRRKGRTNIPGFDIAFMLANKYTQHFHTPPIIGKGRKDEITGGLRETHFDDLCNFFERHFGINISDHIRGEAIDMVKLG